MKNPNAAALGSLGGKARAAKMTKEERTAGAKAAAQARWKAAREAKKVQNKH